MLRIIKEQLEIFSAARLHAVAEALADRALERHQAACVRFGREELASMLEPEIAFAHAVGFRSISMLERYIDVGAALGPGFGFGAKEQWARDILSRQDLSPAAKLEHIEETAIFVLLARR
ncbi:hypothetical protein BE21_04115 [Sorangium cellulosum]|uniref:Uncharacterized protein n=1 Tax=Sorangium cellulosum TaxID=56 RepID=A0A150THM4_SORCE|nr:hypothetical protein BE21_04115 [Sorangium cellulosum]